MPAFEIMIQVCRDGAGSAEGQQGEVAGGEQAAQKRLRTE